jgi:hypothetical protein
MDTERWSTPDDVFGLPAEQACDGWAHRLHNTLLVVKGEHVRRVLDYGAVQSGTSVPLVEWPHDDDETVHLTRRCCDAQLQLAA